MFILMLAFLGWVILVLKIRPEPTIRGKWILQEANIKGNIFQKDLDKITNVVMVIVDNSIKISVCGDDISTKWESASISSKAEEILEVGVIKNINLSACNKESSKLKSVLYDFFIYARIHASATSKSLTLRSGRSLTRWKAIAID